MRKKFTAALMLALLIPTWAQAQVSCRFYRQYPETLTVQRGNVLDREVEIDFTNTGTTGWERTGGVSNLSYIELRSCDSSGRAALDSLIYHQTWINRVRVGSFIEAQNGVAPGQTARFVFRVNVDARVLNAGTYHCYFRPYHATGGWINDWPGTKITVVIQEPPAPSPSPSPSPTPTPTPPPAPAPQPAPEPAPQPAPSPQPTPQPAPAPQPSPVTPRITRIQVERSEIRSGGGSAVQQYDLLQVAVEVRRYQTLKLFGDAQGGTAAEYEWSLEQGQSSKLLGHGSNLTTKPEDLYLGHQQLRLRVRDTQGNWSSYATFNFETTYWPKLKLPVHGSWTRNGNNHNEGDHAGAHLWAEDWNHPVPGDTDFCLEIVASLPGRAKVETNVVSGKIVYIEYEQDGHRFRTRSYHLMTVLVEDGQAVIQGQPIGLCGDTGTSSRGSHLHYVLERWVNGVWQSVAAEPVWISDTEVAQTISYGQTVNSDNRDLDTKMIILDEANSSAPNTDINGWGRSKRWARTVVGPNPTASCLWDVNISQTGRWKLWMHNPSQRTQSLQGVASHNTTSAASFEVITAAGVQTFRVDQGASPKGALVLVAELDLLAGERLTINQHNATGESDKEISFDELVLVLVQSAGSGGNSGPGNPSGSNPMPAGGTSGSSGQPSPPTQNQPSNGGDQTQIPANQNTASFGGGGGGGGCAMSSTSSGDSDWLAICLLMLVMGLVRQGRATLSA